MHSADRPQLCAYTISTALGRARSGTMRGLSPASTADISALQGLFATLCSGTLQSWYRQPNKTSQRAHGGYRDNHGTRANENKREWSNGNLYRYHHVNPFPFHAYMFFYCALRWVSLCHSQHRCEDPRYV